MPPQPFLNKGTAPVRALSWLADADSESRQPPPVGRLRQPTAPGPHTFRDHEAHRWNEDPSENLLPVGRARQAAGNPHALNQLRFGPFLLDCANGSVFRDGTEIRIRSQVYEVIKVLASSLGREVSVAELLKEAWKGSVVSRHTIAVTVCEARKALAEYGNWIEYRPNRGYRLTIPAADDQLKIGLLMAQRCTREGLEKALDRLRMAAKDQFDRRLVDAIARTCLMLGVYSAISPAESLARFEHAYQVATELFCLTPALMADHAHAVHLFERSRAEAERELLEAAREQENPVTYVRLTLLYAAQRRFNCALESLQRARALDQFDAGISAAEMFLWLARSDFQRAVEVGAAALELQPYFYLDRAFYGQALEFSGRVDEALTQYRAAQILAPDIPWLKALEAGCLARRGDCQEAEEILAELRNCRTTTYVDSYYLAPILDALNRREEAFGELWRAREENSAPLYAVDVDPKLVSLRSDRRFTTFRKGLFRS
jgi:DNA-binding winged helix-turn-helix (wHTH) protein